MLLKKLNVLYEQVILETKGDKSVDPAPQKAAPNQSLVNHDEFFEDGDDKRKKSNPEVPSEFAGKVADFKKPGKTLKRARKVKDAKA